MTKFFDSLNSLIWPLVPRLTIGWGGIPRALRLAYIGPVEK